ncbi:hypothetical protein [Paracoccus yeei]|uniref:hypothetical protein n=1 Tax=Paracoccus yeei TaxID=147645 RepID=UPI00157F9FDD|nr:hypothetical protein [Paracoccus yeei]
MNVFDLCLTRKRKAFLRFRGTLSARNELIQFHIQVQHKRATNSAPLEFSDTVSLAECMSDVSTASLFKFDRSDSKVLPNLLTRIGLIFLGLKSGARSFNFTCAGATIRASGYEITASPDGRARITRTACPELLLPSSLAGVNQEIRLAICLLAMLRTEWEKFGALGGEGALALISGTDPKIAPDRKPQPDPKPEPEPEPEPQPEPEPEPEPEPDGPGM